MKITLKCVWRRQALQERCHCNLLSALDGGRVLYDSVCVFLFENLLFVCYSWNVFFLLGPCLRINLYCQSQRCSLSLWVCGSSTPSPLPTPPLPHTHPQSSSEGDDDLQKEEAILDLSVSLRAAVCESLSGILTVLFKNLLLAMFYLLFF